MKKLKLSQAKIKHLIGSFRDSSMFPESDDIEFMILNWYKNEGGAVFVHDDRKIKFNGFPIFDEKTFESKIGPKYQEELNRLQEDGIIRMIKSTGHSKYYELIKTNTYEFA